MKVLVALLALLLRAPQGDPKEIAALLEQLGSDEIAVRESAHSSLVLKGVKVLDLLAARPLPADPEAAARIDGVVHAIVELCVRTDWIVCLAAPVTLDLEEASVPAIVEALRKQTRLKIELDGRNISDDRKVERIRLDGAPFRQALATIMGETGMEILRAEAGSLRIGRPEHLTFRLTKVDPAVIIKMTSGLTGVTFRRDPDIDGALDVDCDNLSWTKMIDDMAVRAGWVALWTGPKEIRIRRKADFEKDAKTESFPLVHVRPEDPAKDRPTRFAALVWSVESKLSHGASWATVHGKLSYDPRRRALVITDRAEVLAEVARLVQELDKKAE